MQTIKKNPAIVFCVAVVIYAASLKNGFVYDDFPQIVENVWIRDFSNLPQVFFSSAWGFQEGVVTNYYRPMMNAVFTLEYSVFGLRPWAFHALNAVIHALNAVLLCSIASSIFGKKEFTTAPLVAGVLFAVHPISTEAVLWASGVPELTFTLFFLASFLLFIRGRYVFSGALFFLSALSKETSMALPLILVIYDLTVARQALLKPFREWAKRYWPFVVAIIVYFILRLNALGAFAPEEVRYPMGALDYILTVSVLAGKYLKMLLLPCGLNILHTFKPITSIHAREIISIAAVALAIVVFIYSFIARRSRELNAPLFIALVTLPIVPVLLTFQVREFPFSERYLYLSSIGFALLIGGALSLLSVKSKRVAHIVFILIAVLYAAGTISRIPDWKNNFTLWSTAARNAPDNFYTRYSLGVEHMAQGNNETALLEFIESARLKPDFFNTRYNLGMVYYNLNRLDESIAAYMAAVEVAKTPADVSSARLNAGNALARAGRLNEAINEYQRAIDADPMNTAARRNMDVVTGMIRSAGENARATGKPL